MGRLGHGADGAQRHQHEEAGGHDAGQRPRLGGGQPLAGVRHEEAQGRGGGAVDEDGPRGDAARGGAGRPPPPPPPPPPRRDAVVGPLEH